MQLALFCIAAAGLTQIIVYGKIFEKIRPTSGWLGKLLSCSMCTGFWSGVFLWLLNGQTELFNFDYSLPTGFLLGCVGSLVSYVADVSFSDCGIKFNVEKK